jgi:hypothetical protein
MVSETIVLRDQCIMNVLIYMHNLNSVPFDVHVFQEEQFQTRLEEVTFFGSCQSDYIAIKWV